MSGIATAHRDVPMPSPAARADAAARRRARQGLVLAIGLVAAALGWSYWRVLVGLWNDWQTDPNYSVGQLVPLVAIGLVWRQRAEFRACAMRPSWWGAGLLVGAQALCLYGFVFLYPSFERYALVLTIWALVLLVGGKGVFFKARWILLFLLLMVPLPGRVHNAIAGPLQDYATAGTVFVLELFGCAVGRAGNVLSVGDGAPIGIAEACSGLRMLTAFLVVAAVLAFMTRRPRWQIVTVLLSSVPVAIVCNIGRLVATVWLYVSFDSRVAETFFHDFAGVCMMPAAIAILVGELWLLNKLVVPDEAVQPGHRGGSVAT